MNVLVACEASGVVRDAFIAAGHEAMSADLLPTEAPGPHVQGDVRELLGEPFDLVVAHPPCTYLANSGVRWLHEDPARWQQMVDGARFFAAMATFNAPRIAIENPVQHRHAVAAHGLGYGSQVVQPWMFGHPEQKATCLWLSGLPRLVPTCDVRAAMEALPDRERQRLHWLPPSPDRWRVRSRTFAGLADAMAVQWGDPVQLSFADVGWHTLTC